MEMLTKVVGLRSILAEAEEQAAEVAEAVIQPPPLELVAVVVQAVGQVDQVEQ